MSHGCIPNVYQVFNRNPPYAAKCYAAIDIKQGEEILTTYLNSTFSTLTRRKKLKESWYFDCLCKRCLDSTENQSFLGALICIKCKEEERAGPVRYDPQETPTYCNFCE